MCLLYLSCVLCSLEFSVGFYLLVHVRTAFDTPSSFSKKKKIIFCLFGTLSLVKRRFIRCFVQLMAWCLTETISNHNTPRMPHHTLPALCDIDENGEVPPRTNLISIPTPPSRYPCFVQCSGMYIQLPVLDACK